MTTSSINSAPAPAIDSGSLAYLGLDDSGQGRRLYITSGALGSSVNADVVTISVSAQDYAALMAAAHVQSSELPGGQGTGFEVTQEVLDAIREKYLNSPDWNPGLAFAQSLGHALSEVERFTNSQMFPSTARYMNSLRGFCEAILKAARESARLRSEATRKAVEVSMEIAKSKDRERDELIAQTSAQGASVAVSSAGGATGAMGAYKSGAGRQIEANQRLAEAQHVGPAPFEPDLNDLAQAETLKKHGDMYSSVAQGGNNIAMTQANLSGSAAGVGIKGEESEQALLQGESQQLQTSKDSADSQLRADESAIASANSGIAQVGNAEKSPGG